MPTLKNMSYRPIILPLHKGNVTIDPGATVEVSDSDLQSETVQKVIRGGSLSLAKDAPGQGKDTGAKDKKG